MHSSTTDAYTNIHMHACLHMSNTAVMILKMNKLLIKNLIFDFLIIFQYKLKLIDSNV